MKILLTGFEPFNGEKINSSWEVVQSLGEKNPGPGEIIVCCLPTVFGEGLKKIIAAVDSIQPQLIIGTGQAGGRSELCVERVALNVADAEIRDNQGQQPLDEPIRPRGPTAYWSTLPIKSMVKRIREEGIPARVSNSAGTYVCNEVMYGVLHHLEAGQIPARAGFIHIPFLPQQAIGRPGTSTMALETAVRGLEVALQSALKD